MLYSGERIMNLTLEKKHMASAIQNLKQEASCFIIHYDRHNAVGAM